MHWLDLTLPTPAANLACDEALLDAGDEVLRFWESTQPFVVVGYSNKLSTEVNRAACAARGLPVLRRCSGGGTVVQGPGSLSYALVLRIPTTGPLATLTGTNHAIMRRHRDAIAALSAARRSGIPAAIPEGDAETGRDKNVAPTQPEPLNVEVHGTTDLALNGLKFSGNAQRRQRHYLLFHGTFLVDFDLDLVEQVLPLPSRRPDYRQDRPHRQFLTNLPVTRDAIKAALVKCWNATEPLTAVPHAAIQRLVAERYSNREWTEKF